MIRILLKNLKGRKALLLLATLGVFLASFSLFLLQGVMNGLQNNLLERSKSIEGNLTFSIKKNTEVNTVLNILKNFSLTQSQYSLEYTSDALIDYDGIIKPVVVHGVVDSRNDLGKNISFPYGLSITLGISKGDQFNLIFPHVVDEFLQDGPRVKSYFLENFVDLNVPELDDFHLWIPFKKLQELTRNNYVNKLRVYSNNKKLISKIKKHLEQQNLLASMNYWEESHQALIYALRLEKIMMIFLFSSMVILISFSISNGLLILLNKAKFDISGLWLAGVSKAKILKRGKVYVVFWCGLTSLMGVLVGHFTGVAIQSLSEGAIPSIFVETSIPVKVTVFSILSSFGIPYVFSVTYGISALKQFAKKEDFLATIRSIN